MIPLGSSVEVGTNVHDKANVADNNAAFDPTGDVTFTFFSDNECDSEGVRKGTVALTASGVAHPSDATGALATRVSTRSRRTTTGTTTSIPHQFVRTVPCHGCEHPDLVRWRRRMRLVRRIRSRRM